MSKDGLRIPPQSIESEKAVLGSIMLRPEAVFEVFDIINSESFYAERHRKIYETMMDLQSQGKPIDILSMSNRLQEKGNLDQVGGKSYLAELTESVPSSANVKYYAEVVQKKSLMRGLIQVSSDISQLGYDDSKDVEEILDIAEKKVFAVTKLPSSKSMQAIKDGLTETWERIEKLSNSEDSLRGVPTGFASLDKMLSGFQPSDLIILAARPSQGKTSLAVDMARRAAVNHNISVGIFSLEMSSQQLIDRMLSAQSQVDLWKIRTGKQLGSDDFDSISKALDTLSKAPIYIDDEAGKSVLAMRSVARRLKSENNLGLIVIDYLQLATPAASKNSDNMVQQVTELSRAMKSMARELNVPVLCLSQLSRAVEARGGRPRLSDLRDSGSIEQDADVVMFIHNESKYKDISERNNVTEILIEKHRNGATGMVELFFDNAKTSFKEIDKSEHGSGIDAF
ncbi:MAG: replicative DNA helicase [Candidatus Pacebacteria bacterium]|nr:replicative DNA helicase [Candidatus Paceibacterota bacterium]